MNKVTIYMPTHNRSVLLDRAIQSVLSQTYKNIELIIVNDGSSDGTAKLLSSYSIDPRIIILNNKVPKGACYSRNRAIKKSSGHFITGLDDDDYFLKNHIELLVKSFSESYSFVSSSMVKEFSNRYKKNRLHSGYLTLNDCLHYNKIGNQVLTLTERVKSVGGFDESFPAFQDYDLWIRLISKYGHGFKTKNYTYMLNSMDIDRISSSNERKLKALNLFISKHNNLFSNNHHCSMSLLRLKIEGGDYTLFDILRLINWGNYYSGINLIIDKLKRSIF